MKSQQPASTPFDHEFDRRSTFATKWVKYPPDVLPFWVADMDFAPPRSILEAISARLNEEILGYTNPPPALISAFIDWAQWHCSWALDPDWLVWLPGVVPGLNLAAQAAGDLEPQTQVVVPTPVYYPFLDVADNAKLPEQRVPLICEGDRFVMDLAALEQAFRDTRARTSVLLLSNPQNPTGRAYTAAELKALIELCNRHNVLLVSDDIHCALLLTPGLRHHAAGAMAHAAGLPAISLFAATKTFNIPGLSCAVAVIPDPHIRNAFLNARRGLIHSSGVLAYAAATAAFNERSQWLPDLLEYLRANHNALAEVAGPRMLPVEATYLGWLDVRDIPDAHAHFLRHGLGLSEGAPFGDPNYVRFNFACPRRVLDAGLERLQLALNG